MKIAIDLVCTSKNSGTKTYNSNFLKYLSKLNNNNEVTIYLCQEMYNSLKNNIEYNKNIKYEIKSNILTVTIFRILWMQFFLPLDLKKKNIEKLYSPMNFIPLLIKFLKIETILCLHSNLPWVFFDKMPGNIFRKFLTKYLMELSIKFCDKLIVNSDYAKEEISSLLNIKEFKVKKVYLGVEKPTNFENLAVLKKFDYNQNYILSVLSCVKYHNIKNLLLAYRDLSKKNSINYKYVLVMQIIDKKYYNSLIQFISKNKLSKNIIIFNNLSSLYLPMLYKNSNLYVFTSYSEVFGLTSLEAMTYGCNVLISNKSSLPEINNDAADYFDPDNIENIKKKIKINLEDKTHIDKLKENAKKRLKLFNWQNTVSETLNIIEEELLTYK